MILIIWYTGGGSGFEHFSHKKMERNVGEVGCGT